MSSKIIGLGLFALGFLLITKFPWILGYQSESMSNAGVVLGLILIGAGLYLILA